MEINILNDGFQNMAKTIKELIDNLEVRVKERTQELEEYNEDLKDFGFVIAHDVKEPLRMIYSYLKLLQDKYQNSLDERGKEFIHYAVDGALRLKNMIDGLQSFLKVNRERNINFQVVSLKKLIMDAMQNLSLLIMEKKAKIDYTQIPDIQIKLNETTMIQVFQNLVANALKYNKNKPLIRLVFQERAQDYLFKIADNGIGIPKSAYQTIFRMFQRLQKDYPGTGVGLNICKKTIERHSGKIWVHSKENYGTVFYFTISKNL
jgi:light-regulated signal transduction histidine kinase (bacteriophytochrome)